MAACGAAPSSEGGGASALAPTAPATTTTSPLLSTSTPSTTTTVVTTEDGEPVVWSRATLTWYKSFAEPGTEECILFNGCKYPGLFAGLIGPQTEEWVMANNIIAVHEKDFEQYKLKTFRLRLDGRELDGTVYDFCADTDCAGCCTANLNEEGFLIDLEYHTMRRFGSDHGIVEFRCLDC